LWYRGELINRKYRDISPISIVRRNNKIIGLVKNTITNKIESITIVKVLSRPITTEAI